MVILKKYIIFVIDKLNIYEYLIDIDDKDIEESLIKDFVRSLDSNDINNFNETFINDYGFEILEKKIKFREIKDGEFFKYQLISMNTIWQINNIDV